MTDLASINKALATVIKHAGSGNWVIGGSAGLMLRGVTLSAMPRDLDLYCDQENMLQVHEALRHYTVDGPEYSETDIYRSYLSHYEVEGIRLELVGGFEVSAHGCVYRTEVREVLLPLGRPVQVQGAGIATVVPLAHELWFNALRERPDRVEPIVQAFAANSSVHEKALQVIERRNKLQPLAMREVRRWLSQSEAGDKQWMLKSSSGLAENPYV
ncbi:nucleotidyltransferase family protein [Paenibacillus sp. strain BS8-2]